MTGLARRSAANMARVATSVRQLPMDRGRPRGVGQFFGPRRTQTALGAMVGRVFLSGASDTGLGRPIGATTGDALRLPHFYTYRR
jgi:hypothetical protein